jgi:hypothetical protein
MEHRAAIPSDAPRPRRPSAGRPAWEAMAWQSPALAPARPQPPPQMPPSRRALERERVKEAADFRADSLSDSWQEAVADPGS